MAKDPLRFAAYVRDLRGRYRSGGLCQQCGMEAVSKFTRCSRCRARRAAASRRWRQKAA